MSRRTRVLSVSVLLLIVLTLLATRFNMSTMSTIIHRTQTPTQTETTPASFPKTSVTPLNQTLEPNEVVWITMTGGLPSQKTRKVLFPERDSDTINKIVTLVNSTYKTEFIASDYGDGKAIGYPVGILIKLKNGSTWDIEPLFKVTTRKVLNGTESTATAYSERVHLRIESNSKQEDYTLLSEQMANYLFEGSKTDMPSVTEFSSTPDTIVPGQKVYISGDGATAKDVLVYIGDGDTNS